MIRRYLLMDMIHRHTLPGPYSTLKLIPANSQRYNIYSQKAVILCTCYLMICTGLVLESTCNKSPCSNEATGPYILGFKAAE